MTGSERCSEPAFLLSEILFNELPFLIAGIIRRIDDLGRVVIPKEIRRTMRIREGDPSLITLTQDMVFCMGVESAVERYIGK